MVLLITAIVAAASAPMINKKLMHDQAESGSPWIYTGLDNSIAYNIKGNKDMSVSIGAVRSENNDPSKKPRLFIKSNKRNPHITFDDGETKIAMRMSEESIIITDSDKMPTDEDEHLPTETLAIGYNVEVSDGALALGNHAKASNKGSIAIGSGYSFPSPTGTGHYEAKAIGDDSIAIGTQAVAGDDSIALGPNASAMVEEKEYNIAIGNSATIVAGDYNIAIGKHAHAGQQGIAIGNKIEQGNENTPYASDHSIAIGNGAQAKKENSVAIGNGAQANKENSVAIGNGAVATAENQIILGKTGEQGVTASTVYIPGNLVVDGICVLGRTGPAFISIEKKFFGVPFTTNSLYQLTYDPTDKVFNPLKDITVIDGVPTDGNLSNHLGVELPISPYSDRRLKNVGKAFTGGLEEVKKLEVFNYTFKKDENKTPRVGVMAHDLEKIFPNAVFKGEDGFLRIRMEDMFYAKVNAIKELDNKFIAVAEDVKKAILDIAYLKKKTAEQEKLITELVEQNKELLKRLEKLEKKDKKD